MRVIFYGGRQAGMIALLTLLAMKEKIVCVIPVDDIVKDIAKALNLNVKRTKNINNKKFVSFLYTLKPDLLVCCQGQQILKKEILSIGCINLHPCLYKYKGVHPIEKLLADKERKASVGVHWMTKEVDKGEVIVEKFLKVNGSEPSEIYNELYPVYSEVLIEAFELIRKTSYKPNSHREKEEI